MVLQHDKLITHQKAVAKLYFYMVDGCQCVATWLLKCSKWLVRHIYVVWWYTRSWVNYIKQN